jgi:hypothetical protein
VFAVALCSGVAMVGASINGLLGIDAELQRTTLVAQKIQEDHHSVRVIDRGDCPAPYTRKHRERV